MRQHAGVAQRRATVESDAPERTSKSNGLRGSGSGLRYHDPPTSAAPASASASSRTATTATRDLRMRFVHHGAARPIIRWFGSGRVASESGRL